MTVKDIFKRLDVLNARHERIIQLNSVNHYVGSYADERKRNQYFGLLVEIRTQKAKLWILRRQIDSNYSQNIHNAIQSLNPAN